MPSTAAVAKPSPPTPQAAGSNANPNPVLHPLSSPKSSVVEGPTTESPRQPQLTVSFQTFTMFLVKAIEKIAAERETRKSQNAALRKACEEALQLLKTSPATDQAASPASSAEGGESVGNHLPPLRSESGYLLTDEKLLRPFQLACTMKSPKIVITAVDSLQKLIAYGHIPNDAFGASGRVRIIEQVVTTICSCFQGIHTDDGIQLQVLKALLTVITSSVVEIHEADVLLAIRTCYNIFMATKNPVNQATARATLTQIINIIFQRMEHNALEAAMNLTTPVTPKSSSISSNGETDEREKSPADVNGREDAEVGEKETAVEAESPTLQKTADSEQMDGTVEEANDVDANQTADSVVRSILNEIVDGIDYEKNDEPSPSPVDKDSDTTSLNSAQNLSKDGENGPPNDANADASNGDNAAPPEAVAMAHVTQKDAFLVFRSLCRLATKDFGGSRSSDSKSNTVRSKLLSLQLILSIFQQPGPLFLSSDIFLTAIKQYLCIALIKNGTSPVPEVCELSVTIFLALLTHFKPHLKRQLEIFLKDVILEILESTKATFEHKCIVIDAVRRICSDAQCIVDIYLNYDCDLNMVNIFERLTTDLAKIAQDRHVGEHGSTISQRQTLRTNGLECLVLILRCMVDWSHELYVSPDPHSFLVPGRTTFGSSVSEEPTNNGGSSTDALGNSATKAFDDPGDFESRKAQKEIYESGINLFNEGKTIQGLQLLQDHGLINNSLEAVAELLRTEERLSKARIGDFLGENDPYNLRVMYAYVDQFDFADKDFVSSMRDFLSGFRLPGEAQKIDRLMEKFAARYCACNPANDLFASADTAYVLAFSIIMLTTDLHSAQIKPHNRMTKDDYIHMNRGINESQDLPETYLAKIYDEIAKCGIKLRTDDAVSKLTESNLITADAEQRAKNEGGVPGQGDFVSAIDTRSDFTSATRCEHVRPMFKLAWTPFLAAFSVGLQDCDALDVAHLCLEGIRYAIRIACIFHMEMERDAYVQALARFTLLLTSSAAGTGSSNYSSNYPSNNRRPRSEAVIHGSQTSLSSAGTSGVGGSSGASAMSIPEAMKQKNIDTIRTLITVAQTDGNYLGHAWLEILRCISQLESAHLITHQSTNQVGSGNPNAILSRAANLATQSSVTSNTTTSTVRRRGSFRSSTSSVSTSVPTPHMSITGGSVEPFAPGSLAAASVDPKKAAILQEVMGETGSDSVVVAVDKIFTGSVRLDGEAIVHFVKALCQVSYEELTLPQPRTFTLQKVVEISYYNMDRIRLQWSRVWEHIGGHFTTAGQSANEDVAEFVIDSLRQLSVKLIEKGELPNFHFQKEFLRPFVSIFDNGPNLSRKLQDMIIRCVSQLVQLQYANIRSGWSNIYAVFHRVASSTDEGIVDMAFRACSFTVTEVLVNHTHVLLDAFQPLVKALADFSCNPHFPDTAMESIRLIRVCAQIVAKNGPLFATVQPDQTLSTGPTLTGSAESLKSGVVSPAIVRRPSVGDTSPSPTSPTASTPPTDDDHVWLKGWMPVLCELFRVINSCKLDVRTRGLTVFFDILKTYGDRFKPLWWRETFTIIFRVFHHFRSPSFNESSLAPNSAPNNLSTLGRTEWMNTTCNHTLFSVVDVFTQYYDILSDILLDEVYNQIRWCCLQEHEQLARSGTSCLETLVLSAGKRFTHDVWQRTVDLIAGLFSATVPHQLLTWRPDPTGSNTNEQSDASEGDDGESNAPYSPAIPRYLAQAHLFSQLLIKCVVQYELIQAVDHILFYSAHSRNEDHYYLSEARKLAVASYPAYSAELSPTSLMGHPDGHFSEPPRKSNNSESSSATVVNGQLSEKKSESKTTAKTVALGFSPLPLDPRGMYTNLSPQHLLDLARCLLESHAFAKRFNSDDEQRNILFEAGFKVKAKPNLLKQETHSLLCSLRILFRLAEEQTDVREEAEKLLDQVILDALAYYHDLLIDGHRQAWDTCLILIVTHLIRLAPDARFHRHAACLYPAVCDLVAMAGGVSPEVAALMRLFLLRCSGFFLPPKQIPNAKRPVDPMGTNAVE
ncbi:unnamed protein product [Calicophoron daubneyi]|uniref:SEC7 domain-containing protein n=1 Tax=Calicophoron daubneyi TaxID=300641 RepID=A0AAV2T7X2_CALDB